MHKKNKLVGILLFALALIPFGVAAQSSTINTFSPYTFYGIGDFSIQGPSYLRSMGGAGVAYSNPYKLNYLNPASLGSVMKSTFLFNFGLEGTSVYAKSAGTNTSYNSFNIRDIAIQFPLHSKIGMGVSVTPLSSVGYRVTMLETDPYYLANIGNITYRYNGSGDIAQVKVAFGMEIFKNFSLGADMIYYHGRISRTFNTQIKPVISEANYNNTLGVSNEDYSKISFDVGFQYHIISDEKRIFTVGGTFQPKTILNPETTRSISSSSPLLDSVSYVTGNAKFTLPASFTVGAFYQTPKFSAGLDYSMQNWNGINPSDAVNGVEFVNSHAVKGGIQYTPKPNDIRNFFNRVSYRVGLRYSSYYMKINGNPIDDKAITVGFGIPIKTQGLSMINVGAEFGTRGNTATGTYGSRQFNMVRENYIKLSLGFSLFGEDYWFFKHKYK